MKGIGVILEKLGIEDVNHGVTTGQSSWESGGALLESFSPVDGRKIGAVMQASRGDYDRAVETASLAFKSWRSIPAPKRGEIVRQMGMKLREYKQELGTLVSYEMGKSLQEGLGEVQEMIDICDFATGLSRQLYGLTMHSERPQHRMYEQWHPLGVVGIISAFNFPVAVWSWNSMIAWVCGNVCVWKPSEKTPLTAIACQHIIQDVLKDNSVPEGVSCIVSGGRDVGEWLAQDPRVALVSATGSIPMGRSVGETVARRLGKSLLELGGNNAIIVTPTADLKIAIPAIVFGAVGTAGQRCTSTRRLIVHDSIFEEVKNRLAKAYGQLKIGNPLDPGIHVGPLIDRQAVAQYQNAAEQIKQAGGSFVVAPGVPEGDQYASGCYVTPCIAEVENHWAIVQHETFAPILYLIRYSDADEAIALQNDVPQGLSSAIFTNDLRDAERFLSFGGSDCGIANVNIGTSGAEIGGAFGGEKETGGGRESGSDAWKAYMRRQTNTINYGTALPLAQGIKFEIE
ncbi:aldehyde dehydrogenase (NAD+) [Dyadobacter sp. BE34]|uniref:aldehyde dehydrogenase (NAD(+)) n=1 Tax=Dyadobacter fermentans TaxID=94254 RepID=A0ABU1QTP5_9BACT|nr:MULTISPECIES: aldehyde dehydrogenase family protein [Dyadobacter]MDR6804039.1 aldehyde dehydrogenase (NAD+) [Dyadobacter fermentans]MDR7041779.1 aldehyde dehydrogenase (NAD+) [Dyadobacter sp. BE242]MDR7196182.1 aldehyde dehydrogenase (NAD+) [Dyadobacter sp. BE34]MDR7213273.1 aldehyde dehydrogenase (NAD+) [Dyadobacter sp. BE31]MDR7261588.1 aldehyde dehydrogenase (NAD+) [Dyadobacter sp. BE32]